MPARKKVKKTTKKARKKADLATPIPQGYDMINPSHYRGETGRFQVVDVIEEFCPDDAHLAHACTYMLRAGTKPGSSYVQDLKKSIWWHERAIAFATRRIESLERAD